MATDSPAQQGTLQPEIIAAAGKGWRLHPLKPRDKVPLLTDWPGRATSDLAQLQRWHGQFPQCNWGIATGTKSGLFAVDCDGNTGLDWLKAQVDYGRELPESWAVHTARGLHLYFSLPRDATIRTSVGKIASGVDVRSEGGNVAAPPSIHPSGKRYVIVDNSCPLSPAPAWLLDAIQAEPKPAGQKAKQRFDTLVEGQRNDGMFRYACALRRKRWTREQIESELLKANARRCSPPLEESEIRKIAESAAGYPAGGLDPLETAWQAIRIGNVDSHYEHFVALARQLQAQRPGLDIALPLVRIAALFGVHFTAVSQWRKRAVATGTLIPTAQYRAHVKAGLYQFASTTLTRGREQP
jgi:Bifunctional DNA primase/polymerase, N-terminal/Primase C terminal 1 (PriCT-1)